jgi:glutamate dehydrogenase (NAD(P)+)
MPQDSPVGARPNLWSIAQRRLDDVAGRLGIDDGMRRVLREPKRELTVHFPVTMDDGRVEVYVGHRVHHNVNRGPAYGGIRYVPNLRLDEIRALAMFNSWKAALVEIPFGGAMGGVRVDPKRLSVQEREGLTRRFATEIAPLTGPDRDIPAPDVNTGSQTMAWMMDTASMHRGFTVSAAVTGKPLAVGGSQGRREATSRGVVRVISAAAAARDLELSGARVAIQGFGRVGTIVAELLHEAGCRIVAIADDLTGVQASDGIDVADAVRWMRDRDAITGMPNVEGVAKASVFEADCDILVLAGLEHQIGAEQADRVRAGIIAEAANGAVTPEADTALHAREIEVIPDILCTSGATVVGYFEWVQDMQAFFWNEGEVAAELDRVMDRAAKGVRDMAQREKVDLRTASTMVAVARVAEATTLRGLYP